MAFCERRPQTSNPGIFNHSDEKEKDLRDSELVGNISSSASVGQGTKAASGTVGCGPLRQGDTDQDGTVGRGAVVRGTKDLAASGTVGCEEMKHREYDKSVRTTKL